MTPDRSLADPTLDALPEEVQDRLARILDDYLVAMELGSPVSPEELLARHPDDAERLRGYLSGLELFHAAAVPPKSSPAVSLINPASGSEHTIGEFRLVREIGRGGMGVVYEAEQLSLRRRVALKVLPFTAGHDEKQISRFKNEAQAAAQVKHPNIVPVFAVGEQNGVHYYAMQLVEGQSLTAMLAELAPAAAATKPPSTVGSTAPNLSARVAPTHAVSKPAAPFGPAAVPPMSASGTTDHVRAVARLGVQAAEALHAAHEYGIVHRDVKPSNLLVDDTGKLWVTDFGLARFREHDGLTQSGDILGTMRYMSPEQATGHGGMLDGRTDVYSLGVTLYELATLHHPAGNASDLQLILDRRRYATKPLRAWNRHIPVDFETIVLKAIAEFPGERYATAQELAADLSRFLEGRPILASPPSMVARTGKWIRRHRSVVYAAAAVFLLAFLGQSLTMVLLARQTLEKERARAAAQENLRQAHKVLDRYNTDLTKQLAAIPGAEGVRAQMLETGLEFYEDFETRAAGDPTFAGDLALAYNRMGSLNEQLYKNDDALAKQRAARAIWQKLADDEPTNDDYARNLAKTENNIALLELQIGQADDALAALAAAARLQQPLHDRAPQSAELNAELATTHNNRGFVLRKLGRRETAIDEFRAAIALLESPQAAATDASLRVLAASYNNLGSLLEAPAAAADSYHRAISLQRRLVENDRVNRLYQAELARTYSNLGYLLARGDDLLNAEKCYHNAVLLQEPLVKQSPLAASYVRDLAISYNNLGMVQSRGGRAALAEASFQQALELQQRLHATAPQDAETLSNLSGVHNNLGLLYDGQRRFAEAEAAYRRAIDFQKNALAAAPTELRYRELLSNHYANFAKCLREQEKTQAADAIASERQLLLAGMPMAGEQTPKN